LKLAAEIKLSSDMDKSTSRRKKKVPSFVLPPAKTSNTSQFTFLTFFLIFFALPFQFLFPKLHGTKGGNASARHSTTEYCIDSTGFYCILSKSEAPFFFSLSSNPGGYEKSIYIAYIPNL
jgi:hypothetical protein